MNKMQPAQSAPRCGRDFLALLSTGEFVVMSYPMRATGWHDYWNAYGVRVPVAETICVDSRMDFIEIVEWYELPKTQASAHNKPAANSEGGLRFGRGSYRGVTNVT